MNSLARPAQPALPAEPSPSTTAARPVAGRDRSRRARLVARGLATHLSLPLFTLLLLVTLWLGVLHAIEAQRRSAEVAALDSTRELLSTYEAQLARSLGYIDQTLRVMQYAVEQHGPDGALAALGAKGLLPPSLLFQVAIAGADGRVQAGHPSPGQPLAARDLAAAPWFAYHRHAGQDLTFVSQAEPVPGTAAGTIDARLHFSRRIDDRAGRFAGVVVMTVDPAYFTSGYERGRMGERGLLGLIGLDGVVRALRIGDNVSWGQHDAHDAANTIGLDFIGIDGEARFTGSRTLAGFPLVAVAGLARAEQLDAFHQQRRTWLIGASAASALLVAMVLLVSAWSWQLARVRRREQLAQATYAAASEASPDAYFVLRSERASDAAIGDFTILSTNGRAAELAGLGQEQLAGQRLSATLPAALHESIFTDLAATAGDGQARESEWLAPASDALAQGARWLQHQAVAIEDGVVVVVRDITERKLTEERIRHLAHHDELTGLPNRSLLRDRLGQAIRDAQRQGGAVGLVFIDLDGFKLVNDALGHNAGDELLKVVGARMERCLRRNDTLARFGGDEFVILLPGLSGEPVAIMPLLETVRAAVAEPVPIAGQALQVSCSMGVTFYPRDGDDANALMMHADVAMYRAKDLGSNRIQFYAREMNASVEEKLMLLEGLRAAIETCAGDPADCQFTLLYQPQVDLVSGQVFGVEALIRWRHPEHGLVSPLRFIGLAEESGLIVAIGDWVVRTACAQAQAWRAAGLPPVTVSVNVSARQFEEARLVERIADALRTSGLPPGGLEVEVTESLLMRDLGRSVATMRELKAMGVALSIDDFGTGYSSLSSLKSFPIGRLKIDKSFVADLADSGDDQAIAMAVISLGHQLGLRVIAEGVETALQRDFLRANGCDEMQGYLFSRPLPPDAITHLLAAQEPA